MIVVGALGVAWLGALPAAAAAPVDMRVFGIGQPVVARGDNAGVAVEFSVEGPATDSTMTVTVPADPAVVFKSVAITTTTGINEVPIACTSGPVPLTYTCHTGAIADSRNYDVRFSVAANAPIGSTGDIRVEVDPVPGPDANPADNSASVTFTVAGHAVLDRTLSPRPATVSIGGQTILHAVVRNSGPDAANNLTGAFDLSSQPNGRLRFGTFASPAVSVVLHGLGASWTIGTLAAGGQATIDIPVRNTGAITAGRLDFSIPAVNGVLAQCEVERCVTSDPITTTTPSPPGNGGGPSLAVTGMPVAPLSWVSLIAVATGLALCAAARRRRAF